MNVLFITYDFPYPITSGGKNRSYNLLRHTAKKENIFLYSFVREDYNPESNEEILNLGIKEIRVFKRRKLKDFTNIPKTIIKNNSIFKTLYYEEKVMEELCQIIKEKNIDLVHFESSYTGYYIGNRLKRLGVKQVLGTENIEFNLYFDYASKTNFLKKPFIYLEAKKLKAEELSMMKSSDCVTVVTEDEAKIVKDFTNIEAKIVANGIDEKKLPYAFHSKPTRNILFVGNFVYFPNIDAINFFYKEVFKKLKSDITLTIIGKNASQKLKFEDKRIIKKDFVENIIAEYRSSDVLVFPVRIGGGTNFKVLEAMALGVPIVAHPDRLKGLRAQEGIDFFKAVSSQDYVSQIENILRDRKLAEKITINARRLVEQNFTWESISNNLLDVWQKTV